MEGTKLMETQQDRQDRQLKDVWDSLNRRGKTPMNTTIQELNRELQLWQINEKKKLKKEKMPDEDQLIDLFFR
jgi:hypothetical protein